jgi:hypothetical protein
MTSSPSRSFCPVRLSTMMFKVRRMTINPQPPRPIQPIRKSNVSDVLFVFGNQMVQKFFLSFFYICMISSWKKELFLFYSSETILCDKHSAVRMVRLNVCGKKPLSEFMSEPQLSSPPRLNAKLPQLVAGRGKAGI